MLLPTTAAHQAPQGAHAREAARGFEPSTSSSCGDSRKRHHTLFSALPRVAAILCGAGILSAATNAVIVAGHLRGADALLVAALSVGVGAGAIVAAHATRGMAAVIVLALLAGEAFNLLSTAERIVTAREVAASTITAANGKHAAAQARLAAAEAARDVQRTKAATTVATPSCARECRALLEGQAAEAATEVTAARDALGTAPAIKSATPLADRLGVQPWALDLLAAALLAAGSNLSAAALLAWGARSEAQPGHASERVTVIAATPEFTGAPACPIAPLQPPRPPKGGLPRPVSPRGAGLLTLIQANGGMVQGSQRHLAEQAGLSKGGLGRALQELHEAGVVDVSADRLAGTVIRLVRAA